MDQPNAVSIRNRKLLALIQYGISLALATWAFDAINRMVPHVYMDELFHVRQTVKYCQGHFDQWDPKITTPPGLYYLGWAYAQALKLPCNVLVLRGLNFFGGVLVLPFLCSILVPGAGAEIASYPLLAFFTSLYYTDVWSTILVVMSLIGAKKNWPIAASITGAASVLFRQTNIVWVAFIGVYIIAYRCNDWWCAGDRSSDNPQNGDTNYNIAQTLGMYVDTVLHSPTVTLPFGLVMCSFVYFVYKNEGIALGDKDNHTTSINICQVLYFVLFWLVFTWPLWLNPRKILGRYYSILTNQKQAALYAVQIAVIVALQQKLVIVHPFLLADNRHYTFYLWRRILPHIYLLAPVYQFGLETLVRSLLDSRTPGIIQLAYVGCVCACLIPSPLFEPRYYILPYLFWRAVFASKACTARVTIQWLWFMVINAATIYIFVAKPFLWPSEEGLQRFMW